MRRFGEDRTSYPVSVPKTKTDMTTVEVQTQTEGLIAETIAVQTKTIAVQTEDLDLLEAQRRWPKRTRVPPNIVAPINLLGPDKKIWTTPPDFFTRLGKRCV